MQGASCIYHDPVHAGCATADAAAKSLQHAKLLTGCCWLQYSLWLDQHSMAEALAQIRTSLEACRAAASGKPGFQDVYPLMLQLCSPG